MTPGFVTQLVADKPQVVAIADRLDMTVVKHALAAQGLELVVVSPSEVLKPGFEWPDAVYKIVWFCPVVGLDTAQVEALLPLLARAPVQVIAVMLGTTAISDSKPVFQAWQRVATQQQQVLTLLSRSLKHVPVLIAQDVVIASQALPPVFASMVQQLAHGVIIDPEVTSYPQAWQSFSQNVVPLLVKPGVRSSVIRGKKVTTASLAKLLQLGAQRTKGVLPKIVATPVKNVTEIGDGVASGDLPVLENFAVHSVDDLAAAILATVPVIALPTDTTSKSSLPEPKKVLTNQLNSANEVALQKPVGPVQIPRPAPPPILPTITTPPMVAAPKPQSQIQASAQKPPPPTPLPSTKPAAPPPVRPARISQPTETPKSDQNLDAEMNRLFQSYRSEHKVKRVKNIAHTTVKTTKKNRRKGWLFKGGLITVGLAISLIVLVTAYLSSAWLLKQAVVSAVTSSHQSPPPHLAILTTAVKTQNAIYGVIFDQSLFSQNIYLVEFTESWPAIQDHQRQLTELSELAFLQAVGRQTGRLFDTTSQAAVTAHSIYELIAQNQARLKELDLSADAQVQNLISDYSEALNQQKKSLLPIQQFQPLLPQLLGAEGRRTYAVLFQNPQELRPTGGFIQAVALITFEDGVLINTQVISAYEIDAAVPGVLEPPTDLQQLLGEPQWYFRDSNWQADFPASATQASWFIERGYNTSIDGVIGLNAYVLRDLLRVLGPVDLPEYNEVITDRNLLERLEFHSELQLLDPQKDYSTLLFDRILQKMTSTSPEKGPQVVEVIRQNFESKQVMMSLKNESELLTLTTLGWSGALLQPACPVQLESPECIVDTVAQVETNVGVNKANAYVDRAIEHQVVLTPEGARHMRSMSFTNTATSNAWPKGPYKNYLRLYVPQNAVLEKITINGQPVPSAQVWTQDEHNKRVFGFLVETPTQATSQVEVTYVVPHVFADRYTYAVFNQQQPGVPTPPFSVTIEHDTRVQPAVIAPQAVVEGRLIRFGQLTLPHSFVGVVFQ